MAAEGNNIRRYIYRGEEDEVIPDDGTPIIVIVHEDVTVILAGAFYEHSSIIEVICHKGVDKIEFSAFRYCLSLRRIIMPGVEIVEGGAFFGCLALTDVECDKLKIIGRGAFKQCTSLTSTNLPSVEVVEEGAFRECTALTDVKFSNKLERIEHRAFCGCTSLERITIPLKDGLITRDSVFTGCERLDDVDLVEGALHEVMSALLLDNWRKDMNEQIESINQILPNTFAGFFRPFSDYNEGEKARVIRGWIRSLIIKIIHYQAEHQRFVNEAGSTLHHALPHEIVMNHDLPFLELPSYTFEVGDD